MAFVFVHFYLSLLQRSPPYMLVVHPPFLPFSSSIPLCLLHDKYLYCAVQDTWHCRYDVYTLCFFSETFGPSEQKGGETDEKG